MTLEAAAPYWPRGGRGHGNTSLRRGSRGACPQSINLASPCFRQPPSPPSCAPTALSCRPGTCRFRPAGPHGSDGIHRCWRSCGIGCRARHGKCPDQRLQWGKLGACSACGPAGERENAGETETVFAQGYKGIRLNVQRGVTSAFSVASGPEL